MRTERSARPWLIGDSWCYHLHARHVGDVANVVWIDGHATSHRLDYAKVRQGEPPFSVEAMDLVANRLGELLRYPRTDPNSADDERPRPVLLLARQISSSISNCDDMCAHVETAWFAACFNLHPKHLLPRRVILADSV